MRAQQQVGLRVGQHLHEAGRALEGPAVGGLATGRPAAHVDAALLLEFLFGGADGRYLGVGENCGRDDRKVAAASANNHEVVVLEPYSHATPLSGPVVASVMATLRGLGRSRSGNVS